MNILTFDIEEPWHTIPRNRALEAVCQPYDLDSFFDRLLMEIEDTTVSPVLFWVGTVAEKYKSRIRDLVDSGFAVGCHGYDHEDFAGFQGSELARRLTYAKSHLQDLIGREVAAFRAPAFSVGDLRDFWRALEDAGFRYDFSVCDAMRMDGGGHGSGILAPQRIPDSPIIEFPMSTSTILGRKMIITGGGYFRISPTTLLKRAHNNNSYNMYYLHPVDFGKPVLTGKDPRSVSRRLRQELIWGDSWKKLASVLELGEWRSGPIETWVSQI